ncbi:MAG TPA: hypothetical protein PLO53_07115 [Candidatus Hydrogenedentes bacterium]|nr:hypothetical protein [Candidatus Hydrogenedentota bacterium]HPU97708.1 hypothetical protein [Candidatus Hydrogenedentota bacterium]
MPEPGSDVPPAAEPSGAPTEPRAGWARRLAIVLARPAFWINWVVILLATCWIPLLRVKAVMEGPDGKVVSESVVSYAPWQSLRVLLTAGWSWMHARSLAMHAGIAFAVALIVWLALQPGRRPPNP